jgi:hypothetical protein
MPTPQERIDAANKKLTDGSYTTKEEKIAIVQELRAATRELIGNRENTQP